MKNKTGMSIFAGILLIGLTGGGFYLFHLFRQPLNQPLVLQPMATSAVNPQPVAMPLSPTPTATVAVVAPSTELVCGQSDAFTMLILGSDAADRRGHPGADLTRLARVDFTNQKVNTFALPRDLWVDVNRLGFGEPPIQNIILGETYYEAYERSSETGDDGRMIDGAQAMAQMVLDNFGVSSDHYMAIDLTQMPALIDAIGGLPIIIPERTTDPWIGMVIEAGPQVLDGKQLVAYARAIPDSDFARIQRNNLILNALRQKLTNPSVWPKIPALYNQFKKMFVTDLSPQQIASLICLLDKVPREEIDMEQVRPEWTSPGPSDSLLWDKDKVIEALKQLDLLH